MKKNNRILNLAIVSFVLLVIGCGGDNSLDGLKSERDDVKQQISELEKRLSELDSLIAMNDTSTIDVEVPKVSVFSVQESVFEHYFEVQGSLDADKNVILVPEAGGLINSLRVSEGQFIQKGDVVATFDSDIVAANMKELEEQIELAKYMYEKQKSLFDQGVGTELAMKQAEGQYNSLQKAKNTLSTQQGKYVLTAPFAGFVEEVFPVQGQMAGPGTPIIRLVSLEKVSVKADISESYLSKIGVGSKVNITLPALDTTLKNLTVKRLGKFVNPVNRTIAVEVEILNPTEKMVPNLMAVLNIRDYIDSNAITVPSSVVLKTSKGEPFVKTVKANNEVSNKVIVMGETYKGRTEILKGLSHSEKVINDGKGSVVKGQKVEITK